MSIINKMLRELDKRHASPAKGEPVAMAPGAALAQHLRPVRSERKLSELFWWTMAAAMLVAVVWVAWLMWQLMPRPLVTDLALQSPERPRGVAAPAALPASAPPTVPQAKAPAAPVPPQSLPNAATRPAIPDMLRLATELTTPIRERQAKQTPDSKQQGAGFGLPKKDRKPEAQQSAAPEGRVAERSRPILKPKTALAQGSAPATSGKIDRQDKSTPRELAEGEFRRAVNFVNQGRIAEGMDGFRSALEIDPRFEAARQTLVALLLEAKRVDEAATLLQQGLAFNSGNTAFVMLLARIMVERGDARGALALLQKHAPGAGGNSDYHAFAAALYQRIGRHQEAIEEYQTALRTAPSTGAWWVGLGISQQAVERRKEALEAFQRAKATGNLAPDLIAFVDQRLRDLQN